MRKTKKRRHIGSRHIGIKIFLLLIVLVGALLYDSNARLAVDDYTLRYADLPKAFDGYRIVQLSDIHTAEFGKDNSTLIGDVAKAKPDIIAVTGDLVTAGDDMGEDIRLVRPLIQSLCKIAPVYYVTGNHEWDSDGLRDLLSMLKDEGVNVLRNGYVKLTLGKSSLVLAGVDDPNGPADMKTPEELVSEIRKAEGDAFIVMLAHRNNLLDRFSRLGVDLVLCGHAHGGIIRLPFIGGLVGPSMEFFPKYTTGVYTEGSTKMVVSRGIGNRTGVPRFLNNPEIPVVILKSN
jgi:predicted MPP superfamily phosphohydrolase